MEKTLEEKLAMCEKQEAELQFKHFSNEDALKLGLMLVEEAKKRKAPVAIDIMVNGYQLFRYAFAGTNIHNDMWINRKRNTVKTVHMSSLHTGYVLEKQGETIGEDWYLDPNDYAFLGGGFPLAIKGTGVVGSICVSGLPHEQDHQMIVDVLTQYLKEEA